jgi:hypothetical protein
MNVFLATAEGRMGSGGRLSAFLTSALARRLSGAHTCSRAHLPSEYQELPEGNVAVIKLITHLCPMTSLETVNI